MIEVGDNGKTDIKTKRQPSSTFVLLRVQPSLSLRVFCTKMRAILMVTAALTCALAQRSTSTTQSPSNDGAPGGLSPEDSAANGTGKLQVRDVWERTVSGGGRQGGYVLAVAGGGGDVARVRYALGPRGGAVKVAVRRLGPPPDSMLTRGRMSTIDHNAMTPPAAARFLPPYYGLDITDYGYDFGYDYDYDFDSYAPSFFYDDYDPDLDPDFFRRRRRSADST